MSGRPIVLPADLTRDEARALIERLVLVAGEPDPLHQDELLADWRTWRDANIPGGE